jgi:hypothetical protein
LAEVARDGSPALLRYLTPEIFPSVSATQRYSLLALQPAERRDTADWERLCRAAAACGAWENALQHAEAAGVQHAQAGRHVELQRIRVRALLELGRHDQAIRAVERWVTEQRPEADDLAAMAAVLAAYGPQQAAEMLLRTALDNPDVTPGRRYQLLRRLAALRQGAARWTTLLEVAEAHPAGSPERRQCLEDLRQELRTPAHAEFAGQLAAQTEDQELAAALRMRQAELTSDVLVAADLLWDIHSQGRLGDAHLAWAVQTWHRAGRPELVIRACEPHLRAGNAFAGDTAGCLAAAYRNRGRDIDARRAATHRQEPGSDWITPPPPTGGGMF